MKALKSQDVTCTYNRKLGKKRKATLNLNARVAPVGRFPADVKEVENCATAFVKAPSLMAINRSNRRMKTEISRNSHNSTFIQGMEVRVCDKVQIRHVKSSGIFNFPIGIGIGMGGIGGGSTSKGAATRGVR